MFAVKKSTFDAKQQNSEKLLDNKNLKKNKFLKLTNLIISINFFLFNYIN